MQVENIVGNPIKEVKKEAMLMQRYVKILINDSQKLVKIAPNILNGAKKLKFTKIASATKNILNSIDAAKWSLITLGELLNDLPQLLSDISNFEKKNNIKDTKVILPEIIEEESNETDSKNEMAGVVIINESELKSRNLSFGQMVFTKDTKRLFIYNGEKLKEIVLKDMK